MRCCIQAIALSRSTALRFRKARSQDARYRARQQVSPVLLRTSHCTTLRKSRPSKHGTVRFRFRNSVCTGSCTRSLQADRLLFVPHKTVSGYTAVHGSRTEILLSSRSVYEPRKDDSSIPRLAVRGASSFISFPTQQRDNAQDLAFGWSPPSHTAYHRFRGRARASGVHGSNEQARPD